MLKPLAAIAVSLPVLLAGCSGGDAVLTPEGIRITRSACPGIGIPAATGDITLFDPATSRDASAIDVVANLTNLRSNCNDSGEYVIADLTFEVYAQRRDARGARDVTLPYFSSVVQGGSNVVAKRVGQVTLHFDDGQLRAAAAGSTSAQVLRSAATLPQEIQQRLTRKRKAGDADAAIDPLAEPTVRAAVQRASFEVLVGFQLTQDQLAYNATR